MFEIIATDQFEKDIKYYKRKKRFTHIDDDIDAIISELERGNFIGDEISGLSLPEGEGTYKVRAINSDTNAGKLNGYRLIYYVVREDGKVFLLTVYYKKDKEDISRDEIIHLIKLYCA